MIVFTNGCFDILHPGHICTLEYARYVVGSEGKVIVGINSDGSAERIKRRPIINQEFRKKMLESLKVVDEVFIFEEDTPYELIKSIKPDYLVKGPDYNNDLNIIGKDLVKHVYCTPQDCYPNISTTQIIKEIKSR